MKHHHTPPTALLAAAGLAAVLAAPLGGQDFDAGSTGALGDVTIAEDTAIDLPADGVLHYASLTVEEGATVTFNKNPLNTPVFILSQGDVHIAGTIDVSGMQTVGNFLPGEPGPGGYAGGVAGFTGGGGARGGAGKGPGAGQQGFYRSTTADEGAGSAAYGGGASRSNTVGDHRGRTYGSPLLIPLVGGSGGGGVFSAFNGGGGGGGGAILVASDTLITIPDTGRINALGGNGGAVETDSHAHVAGSGGAIRLVSPRVYGSGTLNVSGGGISTSSGTGWGIQARAGHGRIRVDSVFRIDPDDPSQLLGFTYSPLSAATLGGNMIARLADPPKLDILNVAGVAIAEDHPDKVFVTLPFGTDPNKSITVQASNFGAVVPIEVVIIPDSGDPVVVLAEIDNAAANPAQAAINVTFPVNVRVEIQSWVREPDPGG